MLGDDEVTEQPLQRRVVVVRCRIQDQVGAILDLCQAPQRLRVTLTFGVPSHDGDMPWRPTRVDPRPGMLGDLAQHRVDALVGEAEPNPHQMPGGHHLSQHLRQLARVGPAVLGGGQHHVLGLVVVAVGEQHRQLLVAEDFLGAPAVQCQLIGPGRKPGPRRAQADAHAGVDDPVS